MPQYRVKCISDGRVRTKTFYTHFDALFYANEYVRTHDVTLVVQRRLYSIIDCCIKWVLVDVITA